MALNPYFKDLTHPRQQRFFENQCIEAIKIYGVDVHYLPRSTTNIDHLFGEDAASTFDRSNVIEMYIKNVSGFAGEGRFLSKFGVEVRNSITFILARRRFTEFATKNLETERGDTIDDETVTAKPNALTTSPIQMEEVDGDNWSVSATPKIGDLIYVPLFQKYFEVKYVKTDEAVFYEFGGLFVFEIDCDAFEYSSEKFNTGVAEIDSINVLSNNELNAQYQTEDGEGIFLEGGTMPLTIEGFVTVGVDATANNDFFYVKSKDVVDFSEVSPFVRPDGNLRW